MKKIKSYTSIWSVEKVLYAIGDINLPVPMTFTQIAWFVLVFFAVMIFRNTFPLSLIESDILLYFGFPAGMAWFMSKKAFDGKKPYRFLQSVFLYIFRPKVTYAGKAVKNRVEQVNEAITIVRGEKVGHESE